ncbi:MAG: 2,4-diaminopentanoate dehydrogenase [bacterium]
MRNINIVIWGFGAMGKGIAEMLVTKKGTRICGVCDVNPIIVGKNFLDFIENTSNHPKVNISKDIDYLLSNEKVDIVLLATDSFTFKAYDKIKKVLDYGINVISTAEEMAYPKANEKELAEKIDSLAKEKNVTVLGTGINPGFVMDLLVIALTGVMIDVNHIAVERVNSLSPFGPTVMEEQGVGISLDEFNKRVREGDLAGHVGFKESVTMISDALGVKLTNFKQNMKPILTSVNRKSKYGEAKKGSLAGIDMVAEGFVNEELFINMKHPQQIEPELEGIKTGDYIKLKGTPNVNMSITPEIDGGIGTIAMCVNMIPHVLNANPGLKTMIDLPVPRAILGDMRDLVDEL